jgi:hypothetical protein
VSVAQHNISNTMDILHSNQSMGMMGISNFSNQNSNSSGSELHYQHHQNQNQNPPQLSPKKFYERNQSTDMKMSQQKFMAVYKVNECKKKFNHDKRQCINWHSQADRRRNPFQTAYSTTEVSMMHEEVLVGFISSPVVSHFYCFFSIFVVSVIKDYIAEIILNVRVLTICWRKCFILTCLRSRGASGALMLLNAKGVNFVRLLTRMRTFVSPQ